MKKRIFIAIYYMEIGGAERSLIGLLNSFDFSKYEVELFIHKHSGELMKYIPENVKLIPENKKYATFSTPIKEIVKQGLFSIAYGRLKARLKSYFYNKKNGIKNNISSFLYITKYTSKYLPTFEENGHYDLAISFIAPHNIVLEKVNATKKIAWIHTDYSFVDIDYKEEYNVWQKYDYIISISENVTKSFIKRFSDLKNKILEIENIINPKFIWEQTLSNVEKEIDNNKNLIKLCSVGRFSKAKNYVQAVHLCKLLVDKGLDIKWYLIGFGAEKKNILQAIKETKMENNFIVLGKKENPYPYILACDIYIQPSIYEGKAITVTEAQILHKPVIITNYPTAKSQLNTNFDGMIVPLEIEKAAIEIENFLIDKDKQNVIINNLKSINFDNSKEIEKIYNLINK